MRVRIFYRNGTEVVEIPAGANIDVLCEALRRIDRKQKRLGNFRTAVALEILPGQRGPIAKGLGG